MAAIAYQGIEDLDEQQLSGIRRDAAHDLARRGTPAALIYLGAMAVFYFSSTYAQDYPRFFYSALALLGVIQLLRILLLVQFDPIYAHSASLWFALKRAVLISNALIFGCVSAMAVYSYGNGWAAMAATATTAGLCAGGLYIMSFDRGFMLSHLGGLILPNFIASLMIGGTSGTSLAILFATYFVYFSVQSRHMHRAFWISRINAIRLNNETKNKLHQLTYHDSVTGLPNRDLFHDRVQYEIHNAKRRSNLLAVLVLGLDRFSKINDTLGHQAGDQLLNAVATRLKETLRENDTVSRYSSDVFTIALANLHITRDVARIASKLNLVFNKPFEISGIELFVTASIGISVYPLDSDTPESLFKDAEATMHRVKRLGGNAYEFYEASVNAETMERLQLESKLRRALEKNEYRLYYQPKINLTNGELCGFEALLRWCPDGGDPVSPLKFIPILEETGLIVSVGEWVLRTACQQAKAWQNLHYKNVRMAVNLSARQFRDQNLVELVNNILRETELDAQWLELEITESMLMENTEQNFAILQQLNERGVSLSIDDFGTGYSSLAYLKRMPIHTLKIDRSFVKDITIDHDDAAVVQTIIAMAHTLRLRVVAEGTETVEQVNFLRDQGCDETQGFYFSRPLPANELRAMFDTGKFLTHEERINNNCVPILPAKHLS